VFAGLGRCAANGTVILELAFAGANQTTHSRDETPSDLASLSLSLSILDWKMAKSCVKILSAKTDELENEGIDLASEDPQSSLRTLLVPSEISHRSRGKLEKSARDLPGFPPTFRVAARARWIVSALDFI